MSLRVGVRESPPWKDRLSRAEDFSLRECAEQASLGLRGHFYARARAQIHGWRPPYRALCLAESLQESVRNGFQLWEKQHLYDGLMRLLSDVKIVNTPQENRRVILSLVSLLLSRE